MPRRDRRVYRPHRPAIKVVSSKQQAQVAEARTATPGVELANHPAPSTQQGATNHLEEQASWAESYT